ncbi:ATP-dependent zinc metalloprotease FtsH [Buchnera aphidicola (Pseudoregma panicola)]|uniref:ATP-dependent zinc metalloprotease FtsH n=1 Tax=Buchnera aphidicola TaxID=9 RepID=UPI0031B6FEDC
MSHSAKNIIIWLFVSVMFMSVFQSFTTRNSFNNRISYTAFLSEVNKNKISEVTIDGRQIEIINKNNNKYYTTIPINDQKLLDILLLKNIKIFGKSPISPGFFTSLIISWLPMFLLIGIWIFFVRQLQSGGKGAMSFGKDKSKMLSDNKVKITFSNVAGCDEAKEEVKELVEYLKNPKKFKKLGGKIPKGILLVGPPGTGKTLLAKAVAGEAKVPFFIISGSDFVEMFVGVGASRVRDMFENARKFSPCIIFVDEIDAVGRQRGTGLGGGHDEREQTLNQILVEMDGFEENKGIILIAATNRPDVLDPALLRPGRFDRRVIVSLPDVKGRKQILKVHMKNIIVKKNVSTSILARGTPGFSGADLANLVNEAALLSARLNKSSVSMSEFETSKDKIIMGSERRSMIMTDKQKECTAYHEAGHVIVGRLVPDHDPVHKVTIIPRGMSLGATFFLPVDDEISVSKEKLESKISTLYGGRLAEEIIYGSKNISTGAYQDIKMATSIARNMVTKWGFSKKLGPILYTKEKEEIFLGKNISVSSNISNKTVRVIDKEIKILIESNYNRAFKILKENIDILHAMKDALIKYETIEFFQIDDLMNRRNIRKNINSKIH